MGLWCLWCGDWFSTLCRALLPGPAVLGSFSCRWLPFGVSAFSDTVCLAYCCAGGLAWAATLPLCSQCFSCAGWLAGVRWVLHPVSVSSHGGCDCCLGGSGVVPYGFPCLSGLLLVCHLLLRFSPSVGAVLCSLLGFPCLRVGALLACGVYGASSLRSLQPRLPFVVGPPSQVCLSFTCSCGGVVWSQVCGPSCCSCVLGSCGVSVAPFCCLGLLRVLPWRVFAWGFLWFRGPSSWSFHGLFTGVISSHFQWLRIAQGGYWFILILHTPLLGGGRCYPGVRSGACRLALGGLRCPWVPRS